MKFSSRKDPLFVIIIYAISIFIVAATVVDFYGAPYNYAGIAIHLFNALIFAGFIGLLLWILHCTCYELTDGLLKYRSGPAHGKIETCRIREVVKGTTVWIGNKPATARKGLLIKYDRFEEIYISPENNDTFIAELLKVNPDIIITDAKH